MKVLQSVNTTEITETAASPKVQYESFMKKSELFQRLLVYLVLFPFRMFLQMLYFMVVCYDKYVYTPIQWVTTPVVEKIPRHVTIRGTELTVFNANIVTLSRTLLALPITICLKVGFNRCAFALVLFHDFLDHLDGIVAKVHKSKGYSDDPHLGSFLDAFCDKVVNVSVLWSIIFLADYSQMDLQQMIIFTLVTFTVISYEIALGIVRVQDYYAASAGQERNTRANMEGKLKEKLESVGLALLCLSMPHVMSSNYGTAALMCFACSICLAHSSLSYKLKGREPKKDSPRSLARKERESNLTADAQRDRYEKVYTIGCFDLLHRGHRNLFRTMRSIGDQIIVGVHSDESIFKLKNKWPIEPLAKRMQNVKKYADIVFAIPDTDPTPYILSAIAENKNSVFVRGDDMPNFPSRESVERLMEVRFVPYTEGISSTALRQKMLQGELTIEQIADQ